MRDYQAEAREAILAFLDDMVCDHSCCAKTDDMRADHLEACGKCLNDLLAAVSPILEAKGRAEAGEDTQRLNWLDDNAHRFGDIENKGAFPEQHWVMWKDPCPNNEVFARGKTFRELLDAARSSESQHG